MSVVVVKDNIMAADSRIGGNTNFGVYKKIRRLENKDLIAITGNCQKFRFILEIMNTENSASSLPELPEVEEEGAYEIFLLKSNGTLYSNICGQGWLEISQPNAMGSGAIAALGALYAGVHAVEAVQAAIHIIGSCGGPVQRLALLEENI